MAKHAAEDYRIFAVDSTRPLLLGESYLIATAYNTFRQYWFGEQYLLLQLPTSRLEHAKFRVTAPPYEAADVSMVNADFVIDGVKGLAKGALASILIKQFEETKNWGAFANRYHFAPLTEDALVSCWVRNLYHAELREVADNTETERLPEFLYRLRALPVFEPK